MVLTTLGTPLARRSGPKLRPILKATTRTTLTAMSWTILKATPQMTSSAMSWTTFETVLWATLSINATANQPNAWR